MTYHRLLGIPVEERHVVSICGAGGKTTLMHILAREACGRAPTALFTTTHIFPPEDPMVDLPEPFREEACRASWAAGRIAAAGRRLWQERRFGPPEEEIMAWLCRQARAVYVESDGSRRLPLKFPAAWEPVLRPETTHTVVVAGLSCLDRPAEEVLHRPELARAALGELGRTVDEQTVARVLWAGYGALDPVFVLNQADTPQQKARGAETARLLRELGAGTVAVCSLRHDGEPG